jgi:hypothetical protein
LSWGRAALKRLDAQNEEQAHEANHYEGRDGKADGAFKQHPPTLRSVQRISKLIC